MPVDNLLLFVLAGWLLNLTPGPDVLYIVTHALRRGVRHGIVAGLGITAGCFVHIFAAALGVAALLAASATAFTVLKWLGAAYLLYMGLKLVFSRGTSAWLVPRGLADDPQAVPTQSLWPVFTGGFWTNVLNPKVALFFLAFVPQFIPADSEHPTLTFLALGLLFNINAMPVNAGWAWAAAWLSRRASLLQRGLHWLDRGAGLMFIGFGIQLGLTDNPAP